MRRYIKDTKKVTVISADIKRRHVTVKVYSSSPFVDVHDGYVLSGRELEEVFSHDTDNDLIRYLHSECIFQVHPKFFKLSRPVYFYKNGAPTPAWYDL